MEILLDVNGSDDGIESAIKGAVASLDSIKSKLKLVGKKSEILEYINSNYKEKEAQGILEKIEILNAEDKITNDDEPAFAIKNKKDSSIVKAYEYMKEVDGTAFISAGSTGAVMAGGLLKLKRIEGVHRPALAIQLPTADGRGTLLLDCGANTEAAEISLMQYAEMGRIYATDVLKKQNVKIGLLNIGAEAAKGSVELKNANAMLTEKYSEFIGNIEAREILTGVADVIVANGLMGNTALKAIEGTAKTLKVALKEAFTKNIFTKIKAVVASGLITKSLLKYDYTKYGGAVLLGIKKPVIKIHGNAKALNYEKAILQADSILQNKLVDIIESKMEDVAVEE